MYITHRHKVQHVHFTEQPIFHSSLSLQQHFHNANLFKIRILRIVGMGLMTKILTNLEVISLALQVMFRGGECEKERSAII